MKATLEPLAAGHRNADIDMLLPWNFSALRTIAKGTADTFEAAKAAALFEAEAASRLP